MSMLIAIVLKNMDDISDGDKETKVQADWVKENRSGHLSGKKLLQILQCNMMNEVMDVSILK